MKPLTHFAQIFAVSILVVCALLSDTLPAHAGGIWADNLPKGGIWADNLPQGGIWADNLPKGVTLKDLML